MPEAKCGFDDTAAISGPDALVFWGPTMFVQVGFDAGFKVGASPVLPANALPALVDTGATSSCIDSALAMQLQLPIVDRTQISGVSGAKEVNMHLAQIHVPALNFTIYGQFAAVDLTVGGQAHHVLLGRTFLQNFMMIYEGHTGTVIIKSPPTPSSAAPPTTAAP